MTLLDTMWKQRNSEDIAPEEDDVGLEEVTPTPKRQRGAEQVDFLGTFDFYEEVKDTPAKSRKVTELTKWRDLPIVKYSKEFDVLHWWKDHAETFPKLSGFARSILGARATSANVERVFSLGRNLVSPLRTSMSAQRVEQWMLNRLGRAFSASLA